MHDIHLSIWISVLRENEIWLSYDYVVPSGLIN